MRNNRRGRRRGDATGELATEAADGGMSGGVGSIPKNKRVWVQNVDVSVKLLEAHLLTIRARREVAREHYWEGVNGPIPARSWRARPPRPRPRDAALEAQFAADTALDACVDELIQRARKAAMRKDPYPNRVVNWWGGRLIEAAYQNIHAAESLIVGLYGWDELEAEIPEAVGRVEAGLARDDPRTSAVKELLDMTPGTPTLPRAQAALTKAVEVGHEAADRDHSRLRSFRNAVLAAAALVAVLVIAFTIYVWIFHDKIPLCFTPPNAEGQDATWVCPTGEYTWDSNVPTQHGPTSPHDVLLVGLLGLLGGGFSAAVAIKNLSGTSTPYDVPLALAALKLPLGALTALGGLIALQGDFVPGLSELDSQGQILAYALVFGYAQQLLTGLLDKRAESLLAAAPGKEKAVERPERVATSHARLSDPRASGSLPS